MSELDKYLEPKAPKEKVEYQPTPTNWPRAPENLRPLLDTWDSAFGFAQWSPFERKRILASARAFYDVTPDTQVLRDAISYMQGRNLDLKDLRSCITVARRLMHKRGSRVYMPETAEEERRRRARYAETLREFQE